MLRPVDRVGEELTRWASSDIARVPTGYSIFDSRIHGGVATGEVFLMMARSSVGKTWFALNVLARNAGTPAIFFSLEMHARYLLQRLAGVYMDVPTSSIENDLTEGRGNIALERTVEDFDKLWIDDQPGQSYDSMLAGVDDYAQQNGEKPRLVIIDFLELVQVFAMDGDGADALTFGLKDFARAADVAVMVLHQVNRGESIRGVKNEGHRPLRMSDARGGGEISPDYIAGMYRPGRDPKLGPVERAEKENDIRLQLVKNRSGSELVEDGQQHLWTPNARILELDWAGQHTPTTTRLEALR